MPVARYHFDGRSSTPLAVHRKDNGQKGKKRTYNTKDSLVVTDPTTGLALTGLSMGERTGSRAFQWVWSYVSTVLRKLAHILHILQLRRQALSGCFHACMENLFKVFTVTRVKLSH